MIVTDKCLVWPACLCWHRDCVNYNYTHTSYFTPSYELQKPQNAATVCFICHSEQRQCLCRGVLQSETSIWTLRQQLLLSVRSEAALIKSPHYRWLKFLRTYSCCVMVYESCVIFLFSKWGHQSGCQTFLKFKVFLSIRCLTLLWFTRDPLQTI